MNKFLKFLETSTTNRILDSFFILFISCVLTFLLVRINIQIQYINVFKIIYFIFLVGLLFFKSCRKALTILGIINSIIIIFSIKYIFPSAFTTNIWTFLIFPLLFIFIIIIYVLRSYISSQKILLIFLGFSLLLYSGNILLDFNKSLPKIKLTTPIIIKSGDPLAELRFNPSISPETLKKEEIRLGLNQSLTKQFLLWLDGILLKGDFGITQQGEKVLNTVSTALFNTIILNLLVLILTWLLSIPLGIIAAVNKDKFLDKIILTISSISLTTPSFLLSIFILCICLKFNIGNIGGITSINFSEMNFLEKTFDIARHLILPVFVLVFVSVGMLIRQMRGNLLDVLNEDYIKVAKAHGLTETRVFLRHALPNAINPLVSLLGFEFAALISGAAMTEMILGYPGIGALTLEAAKKMDINIIMFNLLLGTFMLLLGNILADLLLKKLDPRI